MNDQSAMGAHREAKAREAKVLAQKLNLLLDVGTTEGHTPTFGEISEALDARGVHLSRARWAYMISGSGTIVREPQLLLALSEFFEVEPDFLLDEINEDLPERVEAQLDLVRAMRLDRVKSFATRALGDVSPQTLRAITQFLDDDAAQRRESTR